MTDRDVATQSALGTCEPKCTSWRRSAMACLGEYLAIRIESLVSMHSCERPPHGVSEHLESDGIRASTSRGQPGRRSYDVDCGSRMPPCHAGSCTQLGLAEVNEFRRLGLRRLLVAGPYDSSIACQPWLLRCIGELWVRLDHELQASVAERASVHQERERAELLRPLPGDVAQTRPLGVGLVGLLPFHGSANSAPSRNRAAAPKAVRAAAAAAPIECRKSPKFRAVKSPM